MHTSFKGNSRSNFRITKLIAYPFQRLFICISIKKTLYQYGTRTYILLLSVGTCIPYKELSHRVLQYRPPYPDSVDWSGVPAFLARSEAESFGPRIHI